MGGCEAMLAMTDTVRPAASTPQASRWRGRSGRFYTLAPQVFDRFALDSGKLYLVAKGSLVLWVGTLDDVVHDQVSRARFRLATDCADRVFALAAPADAVTRMTLVWDLEGSEPVGGLSAA